jgi:hypothetical protein
VLASMRLLERLHLAGCVGATIVYFTVLTALEANGMVETLKPPHSAPRHLSNSPTLKASSASHTTARDRRVHRRIFQPYNLSETTYKRRACHMSSS